MAQPQPDPHPHEAQDPNPGLNAEAIPPEQPNAASPQGSSPVRHSPRPANAGALFLVVLMTLIVGAALVYTLYT